MDKLYFLTAGIPTRTNPRTYEQAFNDLVKMELGGLEIEFVHGVNMNAATQKLVKSLAAKHEHVLTAHGPYYINLNAQEEDKYQASIKRILDTARACYACGGYSTTFHAAFYMKQDKEAVYQKVKTAMEGIVSTLKSENVDIWVRPELTGKATQWGDLDELIRLSKDVEMVLPCVDFSHFHARTGGGWNTYDEFCKIFEKIGNELGEVALKNFHAHVAGIEYTMKGERRHLMLEESDMDYKNLMRAFRDFGVKGVVVCESPDMETDAMLLQRVYNSL
ncbi:MAG: TIM barrel protein [Candidatus Gastranaerophilales bacterium]|mgnify:CR=1 FL=1|nr:TIM barrel protein [Candidatus Gastranaerophilales bacterium]